MTSANTAITKWIRCLLLCVVLILPARFYTGLYLPFFASLSNLPVQYINMFDLAVIIVTFAFVIGGEKEIISPWILRTVLYYVGANILFAGLIILSGYGDYVGELISKAEIVFCSGIIATQLKGYTDTQKASIYIISLTILIIAPFFLSGYKGYGESNRVGTIGFGSNEAAYFAACVYICTLFIAKIKTWLRVLLAIVAIMCTLNVASRRGFISLTIITMIWLIYLIFAKKDLKQRKGSFILKILFITLSFIIVLGFTELIENYITDSALYRRYMFSETLDSNFFEDKNRVEVYLDSLRLIEKYFLFGRFGCDKLLAVNTFVHTHNIFLQLLVTYGAFLSLPIICFIIKTFIISIKTVNRCLKESNESFPAIVSFLFILYFLYEMFGYLLWNPKGVLLISLTAFLVRNEYKRYSIDAQQ